MAAVFLLATATVSGADTATRITPDATRVVARMAIIQAAAANTANIFVGDSTVQSSGTPKGIALAAKESISLGGINNEIQLHEIYFASSTTSQKVNTFYIEG